MAKIRHLFLIISYTIVTFCSTVNTRIPESKPINNESYLPYHSKGVRRSKRSIEDACLGYNNDVLECRNQGCVYSCGDKRCISESSNVCGNEEGDNEGSQKCSDNCFNLCDCKQNGCEYDLIGGNCRPPATETTCHASKFKPGECSRPNVFYSLGNGQLCQNLKSRGNCIVDDTIIGIKFNNPYQIGFHDSRGISFVDDEQKNPLVPRPDIIQLDPNNIRQYRKSHHHNDKDQKPEGDEKLWVSFLHSDPSQENSSSCLNYGIRLCEDGRYELSIRLMEDDPKITAAGMRRFTIMFADIPIFQEIDIFALANGRLKPLDLALNFEVSGQGTVLRIRGQPRIAIPKDKRLYLSFCYGACENTPNRNFLASAFSVVKFGEAGLNGEQCQDLNTDPCACRLNGCEFNKTTIRCVSPSKLCSYSCFDEKSRECRRGGAHIFYVDGGVVCNNIVHRGDCQVAKTMLAINFNGPDHTDIWGVKFTKDDGTSYEDPDKVVRRNNMKDFKPMGIPEQDSVLYDGYIWGFNQGQNKDARVSFLIPTDGDGFYELKFSFSEPNYKKIGERHFRMAFGGMDVVEQFDVLVYRQATYAYDLVVPFEVLGKGKEVKMKGRNKVEIKRADKKISLSFRWGGCTKDGNWFIQALSVVKLVHVREAV